MAALFAARKAQHSKQRFIFKDALMPESLEKPTPAKEGTGTPTKAASAPPQAPPPKKIQKKIFPLALHLVQAHETFQKLGFLLNAKCLMGNEKTGLALNHASLRKLNQLANADQSFDFLPCSPYEGEEEELRQFLGSAIGQSVLERAAEPIKKCARQLLQAIAPLDVEDESEENTSKIISHFQKPVSPSNKEEKNARPLTPYMLVQQIQKSIAVLRQRLLLELDTLAQLRRNTISNEDCFHALSGMNAMEIKGRLMVAQEIYQSLQGMKILKKQDFSGDFHPKITLEHAIERMQSWGPGTSPRAFQVQESVETGKTIRLNEKLLGQLSVLTEATDKALGHKHRFDSLEARIEGAQKDLQQYFSPPQETPETSATPAGSPEKTKKAPDSSKKEAKTGLNYEEILQSYEEQRESNPELYLAALLFEKNTAQYCKQSLLTEAQSQELREIFKTLQMDLSQSMDLYLIEAQQIIKKAKGLAKKLSMEMPEEERQTLMQPGKQTGRLPFAEAIAHWTKTYIQVVKKYLLIQKALQSQIIDSSAVPTLCEMEAHRAVSYLEQLKTLLEAVEKGYITQEQKERYLDPKKTSERNVKSILAFFKAIEKYDFFRRSEEIVKGYRTLIAHHEAEIAKDASLAKPLRDPLKQLNEWAEGSEPFFLIHELLNAEIYDFAPEKVFLLVERILLSSELKGQHLKFSLEHRDALKKLTLKSSKDLDLPQYNKLFYAPEEEGKPCLLTMLNQLNGTPAARSKNVLHKAENTLFRDCVLRSFALEEGGLSAAEDTVNAENAQDLICLDYCVYIMVDFQVSFLKAVCKVFALEAETKRSPKSTNSLGVSQERVMAMRSQCELILDKQMPINYALKELEAIWITLESEKIVAKEAKHVAGLLQKCDGNAVGEDSLYKHLDKNPDNAEAFAAYRKEALTAYDNYRHTLDKIAERLQNLNRQEDIPSHILQYQREVLKMERSIMQSVQELREGMALQPDLLKKQIEEKKQRMLKYKKVIHKFQKSNPKARLPETS